MRHYTKILVWENNRRLNKLIEFRELVIAFFESTGAKWNRNQTISELTAPEARRRINNSMQDVHSTILRAGMSPTVTWVPPPIIGGYAQNVNLIYDIFNLDGFPEIEADHVLDLIDRAIGIYESDRKWARVRVFNPLFYVRLVFGLVPDLPFVALGKLGFNQYRMEVSIFGRLVKGVLYLIQVIAALMAINQYWEFWTPIKNYVHDLTRSYNGY